MSRSALSGNHPALTSLIERMASLSNGLGIMGRLKLGRSGKKRGRFDLLAHGLLPLSAALSALTLINECSAAGNLDRVYDLLERGNLDVNLAERMLATWHQLQEFRLDMESFLKTGEYSDQTLLLEPGKLTVEQREKLKNALESVAHIQRYVEHLFSECGEQSA